MVPVLGLGIFQAPALAAKDKPFRPGQPAKVPAVKTRDLVPGKSELPGQAARLEAEKRRPAAPVWPAATTTEVDLATPQAAGAAAAPRAQAPGTPVSIGTRGSAGKMKVTVFGRDTAKASGVDGVLARVDRADGKRGPAAAEVTVDYSAFASAYGADWSSRLRLVTLPECALTTPSAAGCSSTPLTSKNNASARSVTATVPAGSLVATEAAPAGGSGDYTATKLQASSTWSAGGNAGGFSWSYPMRVPPATGGPAPNLSLSYSSQSVDGQTAAENNQPGWAGTGFEFAPGGYIERRYKTCLDDMSGGNNSEKTSDFCWATDNATLSLDGHSGELIYNATDGFWHLRNDDGSRVERRTGASNGDNDGEWWVVTTTNGTQYWFGRNRLPGWASGNAETKSAFTEPVFGNHSGEPCKAATFAASACDQAWRWNLDYVIDVHGNTMSFWYEKATNKYAKNMKNDSPVPYVRDGWLTRIDYGTRSSKDLIADPSQATAVDSVLSTPAPMSVDFTVDDRCLSGCGTHDAAHWTDTPWDQECLGSTCDDVSPTFWTTKRLKQVTTKVRDGSGYRPVETWTLTHTYPDPGDTTRAPLWLAKLSHAGGTTTVPDIEFGWVQKANRVDAVAVDGLAPMNWFRLNEIKSETGSVTTVTYSAEDCVKGSKMPSTSALHLNKYRCYPVRWMPEGAPEAKLEFFHKYVVTEVREKDNTGGTAPFGSPTVLTTYAYPADEGAWHYTDEDGLTKDENKTWSVWRGYGQVTTSKGDVSAGDQPTRTVTTYFRGMHGDKLPSGTRSVTMPAVDMNGNQNTADAGIDAEAVTDENDFAGTTRSTTVYNGQTGAEISSNVTKPWRSGAATASRALNGVTVEARRTGTEHTHARVALDHAPWWRTTSTHTAFDAQGMPERADDFGDDATPADDQCTVTTYLRNTSGWVMTTAKEVTKYALKCTSATTPATLTEDDVLSNVRTSFDSKPYGAMPSKGLPTQMATATAWTAGNPTDQAVVKTKYDSHGRVVETTDALNRTTKTAFTPATGGPVTQNVVTKPAPASFTTTTVQDPAFGNPVTITDTNGKRVELQHDGLGRLTGVWLPGRIKGTDTANQTYTYLVRQDGPVVVTTAQLNAAGGYNTSYALMDGLLRGRQTQKSSPSGGRVVTDTFYDSAGREKLVYGSYHDSRGGPGTTLVTPADRHDVPDQSFTLYDGAGRVNAVVFDPYNNGERWRTSTVTWGDRADVTPPAGGVRASKFTDARGNTTAIRQYGEPDAASQVTTSYTFNRKNQLQRITDNAGNHWDYTYYLSGLVRTTQDPDSGTTTLNYDKAGQIVSATDARNITLVTQYDELGRKLAQYKGDVAPANLQASWAYDTAVFDGTSTPAKGYLASSTRWLNNGTEPYKSSVLGYTANYLPTGATVSIPGGETGLDGTYTSQTTYKPDGSPYRASFPGAGDLAGETTTVLYDPVLGLPYGLDSVLGTTQSSLVENTSYDAVGEVSQFTLYTGRYSQTGSRAWITLNRDVVTGRTIGIRTSREAAAPNVVSDVSYAYDNAGNITRAGDQASGDTQCFRYDALRRLREAWTPSGGVCGQPSVTLGGPAPYRTSWEVDSAGNRTQQTEHPITTGGTARTIGYTYPAAGSPRAHGVTGTTGGLVSTYRYDEAGNVLCRPLAPQNTCPASGPATGSQTFTWDASGRAETSTDATGTSSYVHDADGNRLIRRDPAGKTLYLPSQEIRYTTATGAKTTTRYFGLAGRQLASRNGAGLTWLTSDHQGTAGVALNAASQSAAIRRQTPFGATRGGIAGWANTQGFVGGTNDANGLVHLGAREYDPATGKFLSVDPMISKDDPQSLTGYGYANHNPVTTSDPAGTCVLIDETNCAPGTQGKWTPPPAPDPKNPPPRRKCDAACKAENQRLIALFEAQRRAYMDGQKCVNEGRDLCWMSAEPEWRVVSQSTYRGIPDKSLRIGEPGFNFEDPSGQNRYFEAAKTVTKGTALEFSWGEGFSTTDSASIGAELGIGGTYTAEETTETNKSRAESHSREESTSSNVGATNIPYNHAAYGYPVYNEVDFVAMIYIGNKHIGTVYGTARYRVGQGINVVPANEVPDTDITADGYIGLK
ncbi:RHS repeat domain-containing protein [Longispora albida]|uniref:RHS repeat domain-containing protein n=1 Tax=Longispora albida TaxID=203523 RepID=UPI000688A2AF|nr:RHS repeat-associated core domain-containing protein [Longispora albida]